MDEEEFQISSLFLQHFLNVFITIIYPTEAVSDDSFFVFYDTFESSRMA